MEPERFNPCFELIPRFGTDAAEAEGRMLTMGFRSRPSSSESRMATMWPSDRTITDGRAGQRAAETLRGDCDLGQFDTWF